MTSLLTLYAVGPGVLAAAVGGLRFPDLLTRMHAATKPQGPGRAPGAHGRGAAHRSGLDVGMLVLIGVFPLLTVPVGAHMVGRARFRTGQVAPTEMLLGPRQEHTPPDANPQEPRS